MKTIRQLQQIVNETDKHLVGIDYQNRDAAIEIALAKLQAQPELLREIVADAVSLRAQSNVAQTIAKVMQ